MRRLRFGDSGSKVLSLLVFAAWFLLVVSWIMSVYAYPRLPERTALWASLWTAPAIRGEKSPIFFIFPMAQTLFFLAFMGLAKMAFFRAPGPDSKDPPLEDEADKRLLGLKKEVTYLGLIFLNLIFIHLQTSLILISHGLAKGINRFYFAMLFVVLLLLIPYYRIRRQMMRTGSC
jgi:hypothetical protein